ncbi:MAG TPA: phosphoglycerate dehydrogenase [Acidobacteriota bacterium]|nr:phosphoglycerate dehydrogenase [Acidobacteriota bacterium]HRR25145.1 phosphoglycerate dehydrogenase [Acidobacteriota bacterium]HRV07215.1 phosphoglycerate dehydrogenase [Acidobacteriota bacterium]
MKVFISDAMSEEGIEYLRQQPGLEVVYRPGLSPDDLKKELSDAVGLIVRSKTRVTKELIEAAPELRVIGRAGAGVDNIDLESATRRGIVVMNTPGGNSISAAEHAFALMLSVARKIPFAHASMVAGEWNKSKFTGVELNGKTLGILGLGKIGSIVARRSQSFNMKVLAFDPFVSESYASDLGVSLCDLDEVLGSSDFVSIHLPLNDQTRQIINGENLAKMKSGAFLINTARGALVDEEALIEALETGKLAGAALDVFPEEPNVSPALRRTPNVVLTPHIAASTREAQAKVGYDIAVQVADYLLREIIVNAVNFPSLSPRELEQLASYIRLGEKLGGFIGTIARLRFEEIGIRYYGELTRLNYKVLSNYVLKGILKPILSEDINEINARKLAAERGISVIETVSSRERSYANLISIQLRAPGAIEWVEGALLRQGDQRLVSVDGIPAEIQLGPHMLFVRNEDRPGVVGQLGTILGEAGINIASFVLGRDAEKRHAVGVINTDGAVPEDVMSRFESLPLVRFACQVQLPD